MTQKKLLTIQLLTRLLSKRTSTTSLGVNTIILVTALDGRFYHRFIILGLILYESLAEPIVGTIQSNHSDSAPDT